MVITSGVVEGKVDFFLCDNMWVYNHNINGHGSYFVCLQFILENSQYTFKQL